MNWENTSRQHWLSVLARMTIQELTDARSALEMCPPYENVREPQSGLMMAEGRAGGSGGRFNLGQISVSRAAVRLNTGELGIGYCLGQNEAQAELIALFDALLQTDRQNELSAAVIEPAHRKQRAAADLKSRKAASSKVDFFTMVRGDNPDRNLRK